MTWFTGTATGLKDLHRIIRNKVCGYMEHGPITFSGAGDGELSYFGAKPGGNNETWTITCTTPGTNGVAQFSVVGSTSLALADATAGVYYDTPQISFMIVANLNDFIATTDVFSVTVTGVGQATTDGNAWIVDQEEIVSSKNGSLIQMHGVGLSLDKHVGVITSTAYSTNPERNAVGFFGCSGYNDLLPIVEQDGVWSNRKYLLVWDSDIDYRIILNNQRFIVLAEVSATGRGVYAGFFFPYGPPTTYGFPLYIGSDCASNSYPFGDTSRYVGSFVNPGAGGGGLNVPGGGYETVQHYSDGSNRNTVSNAIWPTGADYSYTTYEQIKESDDGTYSMFPATLVGQTPGEMLGELDGVCCIPGFNLAIKDTINDGVNDWVIWNDSSRTNTTDFYAVRLI